MYQSTNPQTADVSIYNQPSASHIAYYDQQSFAYAAPSMTYPCLTAEQQAQLQMQYEIMFMATSSQIKLKEADYQLKKDYVWFEQQLKERNEQLLQNNRLQLLEARQQYQLQLQELTSAVILDSTSHFCREICIPDKKRRITNSIFNFSNPKITRFFALGGDFDSIIELSAKGLRETILFLDDDLGDAKRIKKKLVKAGVIIRVPRRVINETLLQFSAYLIQNAEEQELPLTTGWCLTRQGFVYERNKKKTLIGKKEVAKR